MPPRKKEMRTVSIQFVGNSKLTFNKMRTNNMREQFNDPIATISSSIISLFNGIDFRLILILIWILIHLWIHSSWFILRSFVFFFCVFGRCSNCLIWFLLFSTQSIHPSIHYYGDNCIVNTQEFVSINTGIHRLGTIHQ